MNRDTASRFDWDLRFEIEALLLIALLALVGHWVQGVADLIAVLIGLATLTAMCVTGYLAARLINGLLPGLARRVPELFWVSSVAIAFGLPFHPLAPLILTLCDPLSLIAVMTPIMAFAALGVSAREVRLFRRVGLQMVVVSMLVFLGTYIGSALIAQALL